MWRISFCKMRNSYNFKRGRSKSWQQFGSAFPSLLMRPFSGTCQGTWHRCCGNQQGKWAQSLGRQCPKALGVTQGLWYLTALHTKFLHPLTLPAEGFSATDKRFYVRDWRGEQFLWEAPKVGPMRSSLSLQISKMWVETLHCGSLTSDLVPMTRLFWM